MHFFILFFLLPFTLFAGSFSAPLLSVDGKQATVEIPMTNKGVSGFIVRHFTDQHRAILANAVVTGYDREKGIASLELSEYTGLQQSSLPNGTWIPQAGDEAVLGFAYSRSLLIAPTDEIYHAITSRIPSLEWIHPDIFATFLSYRGHPTPIKEDIRDFCTMTSSGLLYIYLENSLFTMDCKSLALLQITPANMDRGEEKLPFYFRFESIKEAWWGEGSDPLESYDPYYHSLISENNTDNDLLKHYQKKNRVSEKTSDGWFDGLFDNIGVGFESDEEK